MSREYPPWIAAYLVHYLGPQDAAKCTPIGRVQRCPRTGPGSCERLGYWFRDESLPTFAARDGTPMERLLVIWDGKTTGASRSAMEYGMVNPDLPYGIDLGVYRSEAAGYFSCGWCGHPENRAPPPKARAAVAPPVSPKRSASAPPPPKPTPRPRTADEDAKREELERWAEKLECVNPAMAQKVRLLLDVVAPSDTEGR
jgi:hypothetical protein